MYDYVDNGGVFHNTLNDGEDLFIKDKWKREYHFRIASFMVPTGLASEAIEVKDGADELGYKFNILLDPDTVPEVAKEILITKIKKGINRRYLKKRGKCWEIGAKDVLSGRIESNDDFTDTDFERVFVIDGKRITIEQFGQMFGAYEGWEFKFQILDAWSED